MCQKSVELKKIYNRRSPPFCFFSSSLKEIPHDVMCKEVMLEEFAVMCKPEDERIYKRKRGRNIRHRESKALDEQLGDDGLNVGKKEDMR